MATSNSPLAPDAETDIDGPDVFPAIKPITDLGVEQPPEPREDEASVVESGFVQPEWA
jgi:hypothetical protein